MVTWHETFAGTLGCEQPRDHLITHAARRSA